MYCAIIKVLRDRSSYVIGKLSSTFRALLLVASTKDILFYRKLKQCLPSGEPLGWPMSTTRASPPRWRGRPSRLVLSRWGGLHDFIIMFTLVRLVWSSPNPLPVQFSVHYIDLSQNLRRRPRSARSPLSSSRSGIAASLWEQNSELEAQKLLVLDVVLDKEFVSMCKNISLHWQT